MKKYQISVDEPWDFQKPDGENEIIVAGIGVARIETDVIPAKQYSGYLVKVFEPFFINQHLIQFLLLRPRYQGDTLADIMEKQCIVGISVVNPDVTFKEKDLVISGIDVTYSWIGSIQPIDLE